MMEFFSQFMGLFLLPENVSLTGIELLVHPSTSLLYATSIVIYAFLQWRGSQPVRILINDLVALEQQLSQHPLKELLKEDGFIEKSLVKPAWRAFKSSAHIKNRRNEQHEVWLFTPPAAFFNSTLLDHAPVNLKRLRAIPDKLIGIGLLLTFLTLVMALAFVSKKSSDDVNALTVLLMLTAGTKFLISIAGLGSAIVFRSKLGKLETSLRDHLANVCYRLEQNTSIYTPEHLLVQLIETSNRQGIEFEKSAARIASHIGKAVDTMTTTITSSISNDILEKMEARLSGVLNHAEHRFQEVLQQLVDDSMSAGQSFKKEVEASAQHFASGVKPSGQLFTEQINSGARSLDQARQQFVDTLISKDSAFSKAINDAGESFKLQLNEGAVGFNQRVEQGTQVFNQQLNSAGDDFRQTVQLSGQTFQQQSTPLLGELAAIKTDIGNLTQNIGVVIGGVGERMHSMLGRFDTIHNELHQVNLNLRHLGKLGKALDASKDSLTTSAFSINTLTKRLDKVLELLQDLTQKVSDRESNSPQDLDLLEESMARLTMTVAELESIMALRLKSETELLENVS